MLTRRESPVRIRYVSGNMAIFARFHAWPGVKNNHVSRSKHHVFTCPLNILDCLGNRLLLSIPEYLFKVPLRKSHVDFRYCYR